MNDKANNTGRNRRPVAAILLCNLFLALTVAFFSPVEVLIANAQEFNFPVRILQVSHLEQNILIRSDA